MKKIDKNEMLIHFVLIIGVLISVGPFIWMILTSLKTVPETTMIPPVLLPEKFMWSNFSKVWTMLPFGKFFINTIISTVVIVVGQIIFCSMAGFAFGRLEFPHRDKIFVIVLAILMVPSQIYLIPQYLIIQKLKLLNTIPALYLPGLFSAFGTFLMRQFFKSLPKELEEAAIIDGCNYFQVYWKIMLPLIKPAITSLTILTGLYGWNSLMWPLIVNTSESKMTLSAGIASLDGQFTTDYTTMMAGALIATAPMLIAFIIFQKKFIEGIAASGSKG